MPSPHLISNSGQDIEGLDATADPATMRDWLDSVLALLKSPAGVWLPHPDLCSLRKRFITNYDILRQAAPDIATGLQSRDDPLEYVPNSWRNCPTTCCGVRNLAGLSDCDAGSGWLWNLHNQPLMDQDDAFTSAIKHGCLECVKFLTEWYEDSGPLALYNRSGFSLAALSIIHGEGESPISSYLVERMGPTELVLSICYTPEGPVGGNHLDLVLCQRDKSHFRKMMSALPVDMTPNDEDDDPFFDWFSTDRCLELSTFICGRAAEFLRKKVGRDLSKLTNFSQYSPEQPYFLADPVPGCWRQRNTFMITPLSQAVRHLNADLVTWIHRQLLHRSIYGPCTDSDPIADALDHALLLQVSPQSEQVVCDMISALWNLLSPGINRPACVQARLSTLLHRHLDSLFKLRNDPNVNAFLVGDLSTQWKMSVEARLSCIARAMRSDWILVFYQCPEFKSCRTLASMVDVDLDFLFMRGILHFPSPQAPSSDMS
ncbi:hypothetical protein N7462_001296 [Penicillium macrosclerotiorum]|uniref:uncharacterized protein n=1 Tax=Penicillium macrosclerotiorum TaxID=303699 RepID=UPI002548C383|nr:uncharacterized protein N7462_001296 [Penicillium macrosclerotiorum]KAJ5691873.1 hypothetical protein N7462_001296 [Penicillium macrosclerotiorum]